MVEEEKIKMVENDEEVEKVIDREMTREEMREREARERLSEWVPKTQLGKDVKSGKITDIDYILDNGQKILEAEIVDTLLKLKNDVLMIGQAKGKFGGGKRRAWKQTQKKSMEGNIVTFAVMAVVGDGNGHVGIGYGKAKETLPAREKALRDAKLNLIKIARSCGSYDCSCKGSHSIPFTVTGKCSSCKITLMPAPQGTGIVAGDEVKRILKLAGIKDVYSKSLGSTRTTINLAKAVIDALTKLKIIERK